MEGRGGEDGVEHLVLHLDERGRLARNADVVRGDGGHEIADAPDLFADRDRSPASLHRAGRTSGLRARLAR